MILFKIFYGLILIISIIFLIQKFDSISNCKTNCNNTGILIGICICVVGIKNPTIANIIVFLLGILSYFKLKK